MAISPTELLQKFSLQYLRELGSFGGLSDDYETAGEDFALLMINLARGMARTIDSLTRLIAVLQES